VLLAAAIAVSEDYDGSQVFGSVLALLVLATMVPLPASIGVLGTPFRAWLPWLGAGFVFFGGAMLGSIGLGLLMMPVGVAALIGAAMVTQHEGDSPGWGILAFFAGFVILLGFFFVVLLPVVEG
jgi:hypothetical protein